MEQRRDGKVHQRKKIKLLVQPGKELREGFHCHPPLPGGGNAGDGAESSSPGSKMRGNSPRLWLGRFRLDSWGKKHVSEGRETLDRAPARLWDPRP